jgi:S1-C subfamily serine protease
MDSSDEGIHVKSAFGEMPAAKAGIMDGDRLVSVDGLAVEDTWDVILVVRSKKPGDDITVVIEREGEKLTFTPRFPEAPEQEDR